MRWQDLQGGGNMQFRGGGGGRGLALGGGGIGVVAIAVIVMLLGGDPCAVLGGGGGAPSPAADPGQLRQTQEWQFTDRILKSTETVWTTLFATRGAQYQEPTLTVFEGQTSTACGAGQAAMGPFYCPADRHVYLDFTFFRELSQRFGAPGDFAQAYVIAHEVGHHIQALNGTNDRVRARQARAGRAEGNRLSVMMELQADCLAGVWAATEKQTWEAGDVEEGLRAASAIGDDRLQKQSQGYAVPESFTHGSSDERMQWLQRGLQSGDPNRCDTFGGEI